MPTKVFISWGGDQSRELAQALYEWLPAALQFVEPYFSPLDIEKGAKWNIDVSRELDSTNIGVLCLTPDNLTRPWILFEAGALSKSRAVSRVCPLLFNLEPTELTGPLTTLQAARFNNEEFKQLISTINAAAGDAGLKPAVLDAVVEKWWPDLDAKVRSILEKPRTKSAGHPRSEREMLEEVLQLTRHLVHKGDSEFERMIAISNALRHRPTDSEKAAGSPYAHLDAVFGHQFGRKRASATALLLGATGKPEEEEAEDANK